MGKIDVPKTVVAIPRCDIKECGGGVIGGQFPIDGSLVHVMGDGGSGDSVVGGFAGGGDGAGEDDVVAEVSAMVDSREDPIWLETEAVNRNADAISGISRNGETVGAVLSSFNRDVRGGGVAALGATPIWGNDPYIFR